MGFFDTLKKLVGGDARTPTMEWILGVEAIVTDVDDDPAKWPEEDGRAALDEWWNVSDQAGCQARLAELAKGTAAWDCIRAIHVARMAVSAGYLTEEASIDTCVRVGRTLQRTYSNWQAMALAYWERQREWAAGAGAEVPGPEERQQQMGRLHIECWQGIDFRTALVPPRS